jgi:hypothetical protein
MRRHEDLLILAKELENSLDILVGLEKYYQQFIDQELPALGRKQTAAIVIAQVLDNFYTCLETLFLRISRFFENSLDPEKWHADLLDKMTLDIQGIRERVVSAEAFPLLLEVMRFRHFKRYYFEMEFDWDKLDFLQKKYRDLNPIINRDLKRFLHFLNQLRERDLSGA